MSHNNNHKLGEAPLFHVILSTGFGIGFWPWGPGTLAGFFALIIWLVISFSVSPLTLVICSILLVLITFFLGIWTDNVMEKYWGEDPRTVVIDEFFGTWIAVFGALFCNTVNETIFFATLGFLSFRILDITKPLGCRWIDQNIHGGLGCMLDDALAALYAIIVVLCIRYFHAVDIIIDLCM